MLIVINPEHNPSIMLIVINPEQNTSAIIQPAHIISTPR